MPRPIPRLRVAVLALAIALLAAPALADRIRLANGKSLEGKARRDGDEVVLTTRFGEMRFKSAEVTAIEPGKTTFELYKERAAKTDAKDAKAQLELGDWCRGKRLKSEAKRHWRRVLELDTDHAEARKRLGFIRYQGAWLTSDAYRRARGFVKVKGKWVLREKARRDADAKQTAAAQRKHLRTIRHAVARMASRKRAVRKAGKLGLREYAQSIGDERLAAFADQVASHYNRQWGIIKRQLSAKVLTEVRATLSKLKRPIPTISTSLGAASTPVRIQLPELQVASIRTTVLVPADIELDEE